MNDSAAQASTPEDAFSALSLDVSLTVADLALSVAWYRDGLGFSVAEEHAREGKLIAVSMRAGSARILLARDDGAHGTDRVKGAGFSMQFTTTQSIDGVAERMRASGNQIAAEPADTPWGVRMMRLVDPDGFRMVVSSPRKRP